jgi:diguanylate cyclase (GGDEF)-like protein
MSQQYEINIDSDTADRNRLSIFVNYRVENKQGDLIGVIGVGLSMETVVRLIENYQQRYGREIYFVNRQGEVMLQSSHYSHDLHLQNKDGLEKLFLRILTSPSASVSFQAKNGNVIYLNSRLVPEFDWFLIVEQLNDPASEKVETALLINLLISLAISIAVLLVAHFALKGYQGRLETMATRDKLTGAASRQVIDSLFEQAVSRSKRRQQKTTLALIDIDHFKQVNDSLGHHQGDKVLEAVAKIIQLHIREADVLCRWGGEEFLLLLNECDLQHAMERVESIRLAIAAWRFHLDDASHNVTVSAGLAEYESGESLSRLVDRADKALYRAKHQGRNCLSTSVEAEAVTA